MAKKAYVNDDNQATFVCDVCNHAKIVDVSRYTNIGKALTVKCKCKCGNQFEATLEKRGILRKAVSLAGTYTHISQLGDKIEGRMAVRNLSRKGMQLELNSDHDFQIGDILDVDFRLDDVPRSPVQKKVIIRNIRGRLLGTEFSEAKAFDKMLGIYLMK
ncbi:MAG: PilZ domain-containing protein [Pseudomonadota bacterium]